MDLFIPSMVGCPVCNKASNSHSGTAFHAHTYISDEKYKGFGCGHEFSLYEALSYDCSGFFGIIGVFSQQSWHGEIEVEVGKLVTLPQKLPEGYSAFAVFLTPYTPKDGPQVHYIPKPFSIEGDELIIYTVGLKNVLPEDLGTKMKLDYLVQAYYSKGAEGWKKILYEALGDFAEKRKDRAVYKLSQSLELYCDRVISLYLSHQGLPDKLIKHFFKTGKNWDARKERVLSSVNALVDEETYEHFKQALTEFYNNIRPLRNSFSHDEGTVFTHETTVNAFETSFPIFWGLEKARKRLAEGNL